MPNKIETRFLSTEAGEPIWANIGNIVKGSLYAEEALEKSGLNWRVNTEEVFDLRGVAIPETRAVVRDTDKKVLGVVSNRYRPVQNTDAFKLVDELVGAGKATYTSAGSLKGGSLVWMLVDVKSIIEVIKGDPIMSYLMLSNGHDGKTAFTAGYVNVRVECWNTWKMAMGEGDFYSAKHTRNVFSHVKSIADFLNIISAQTEDSVAAYTALAQRQFDITELQTFLKEVFPTPTIAPHLTPATTLQYQALTKSILKDREEVVQLMETGLGANIPGVRGSLYGLVNAVTEWADHSYRGSPQATQATPWMDRYLNSIWFGGRAATKQKAFRTALAMI